MIKFITYDLFSNVFDEDRRYQFNLAKNVCLLAKGHLDELQRAEKYPIGWSL